MDGHGPHMSAHGSHVDKHGPHVSWIFFLNFFELGVQWV